MPDSSKPQVDERAIVLAVLVLLLVAVMAWFLYARGVRTTIPPAQPLVGGGKK